MQGNAHESTDAQIKFLYYPLVGVTLDVIGSQK